MLHSKAGLKTSFLGHLGRRLRWLPVYAILFLLSSSWFPLSVSERCALKLGKKIPRIFLDSEEREEL